MSENTPSVVEALGQSEAFLDFQARLSKVAPVERPVLLVGERGTGKELAASRLHYLSGRWDGPFVTLNCSTLSSSLIEAELFGHEKGAFTGAERQRAGRFETAHGGTLFLDEIGTIPLPVQEKILRVVEYGSFERVGGSQPIEVDVRIVGATNADLAQMADGGEFKRDLLDRLSFEVLYLPPLRSRREDIMLLANHFATRMAFELGYGDIPRFGRKATGLLERYAWKGNVRELKNVVERAVYQSEGHVIDEIVFNPFVSPYPFEPLPNAPKGPEANLEVDEGPSAAPIDLNQPFKESVRQHEHRLLQAALEQTHFNQRKAAQLLQLSYDQFRGLLKKHKEALSV
ncbi:Psp operon transcriptional activator [Pontiella desulfatans]|uniref:Psp operon transcriptional activator n=1 Tax=Pontiella desulfatans TaxID=2750659 RepID=A0A6C2U4N9_PONDE|nr:phage shock protein operon transcriptional activator [Pontiella desulfatans]VGO14787.1 Psp operon transcriptional activator [Pontiella desulfatans]